MTIQDDTEDLVDTSLWGEQVTVVRNYVTYGQDGTGSDDWQSVETPNADIQPTDSPGPLMTEGQGQVMISTHRIFLPADSVARQGDRIRPSGWEQGNDEHNVDHVLTFEDHLEVLTHLVKGHA